MPATSEKAGLSGRRKQAANNDIRILDAARAVLVSDPHAPMAAIAGRAGVGMSALYRRYDSKEVLLQALCREGLSRYIDEARAALEDQRDPWTAFTAFMHRLVDSDTHSLAPRLAGLFPPAPDLFELASVAQKLNEELFARLRANGGLRPDVGANDLSLISEFVAALTFGDAPRTLELRHRYLTLLLDGLRYPTAAPLPGQAPLWREFRDRWNK